MYKAKDDGYASFALEDLGSPHRLSQMSWEDVIENYKHPTEDEDVVKRDSIFAKTTEIKYRTCPKDFTSFLKFMAGNNRLSRHVTIKLGLRQGLGLLTADETIKQLEQYEEIIVNEAFIKGFMGNREMLSLESGFTWRNGQSTRTPRALTVPTVYHSALLDYAALLGLPLSYLALIVISWAFSTSMMYPAYTAELQAEVAQFRRRIEDRLTVFRRRYSPPDLTA
jgi:hypothetical protein